jgi:hypothetical protein
VGAVSHPGSTHGAAVSLSSDRSKESSEEGDERPVPERPEANRITNVVLGGSLTFFRRRSSSEELLEEDEPDDELRMHMIGSAAARSAACMFHLSDRRSAWLADPSMLTRRETLECQQATCLLSCLIRCSTSFSEISPSSPDAFGTSTPRRHCVAATRLVEAPETPPTRQTGMSPPPLPEHSPLR